MSVHTLRIRAQRSRSERLDNLLSREIPAFLLRTEPNVVVSRAKIRRLIIAGAVLVNGRQERRPDRAIPPGAALFVKLDPSKFFYEKQPDDIPFDLTAEAVLYEDEWLLIVNKPARFPTEATIVTNRDHLHAACKRYLAQNGNFRNQPYCGLLHRLDRETSGVILFTKTRTVNASIQEQFVNKTIQKRYVALTLIPEGNTVPKSRRAQQHLACGSLISVQNQLARISSKSSQGIWGIVPTGGLEAHTDVIIVEQRKQLQLVNAWPRTGRTHQIRVHLASLGIPILGDALYGGTTKYLGKPVPRGMLHAAELHLVHPISGKTLTISAPLPEDFQQFWEQS